MDKFTENFHHTQPVEFYDDVNEGSLRNLERSSLSEVIPIHSKQELSLEAYGKMIIPKPFDGKTDPRIWVQHYEVIAEANLWDDDMKARRLIASLDGAAQQWLLNQRMVNPNLTWKPLKEKLINRFSNSIEGLVIIDSDKLFLKKTEDFDKYWEEKKAVLKLRSSNISQKEMMQKLFDGLNKELKAKVLSKIVERRSETVDELYRLIKEIIDIEEYKKEMESTSKKKTEKYHKRPELDINQSEHDKEQYNNFRRKMSKIRKDLNEIKSLIIEELTESCEGNVDTDEKEIDSEDEKDVESLDGENEGLNSNKGRNAVVHSEESGSSGSDEDDLVDNHKDEEIN